MTKYIFTIVAVLVVIGTWVVFHNPSQSGDAIKLGVIAGTTGDYAAAGEGYVKGFTLAQEEWNATHSQKFTAVIEDDGFNAQKGVSSYQKLKNVDEPAAYAVLSSFTIDAIANDLKKEGKPVALGFEQSTPAQDDNIFQVLPAARPVQQGLGSHLKELGFKKPLMFVSNNTPVYQNFAAGFKDGYGSGTITEEVTADKTAVRGEVTRALAQKPDVLVFFTDPPIGALLAKEILLQAKGDLPKLAFDQSISSGIQDYKSVFGDNLTDLNGSIVALSRNDLTESFKTAFSKKYGVEAPFGADMGYNSFMLLAHTYNVDKVGWVNTMRRVKFTGADGDITFDAVGLRVPNVYFANLKDGSVTVQ